MTGISHYYKVEQGTHYTTFTNVAQNT